MLYRRLGRTGLHVSELSYGAARGAVEDPAGFVRVVRAAIAEGVNFIDTAGGYDGGDSEKMLGEALKGHDDVLVETKYCPYESYAPDAKYNGTARALRASAEESLRRLRRDRLDILLGHGMRSVESMDRFMSEGCYEEMLRLKEEGLVRFVGVSELSEADGEHEVLLHALPGGGFDVVMLTINLLLQTAVESVLPLCRALDVGTVVMMPLNQASCESGLVSVPAALECVRRHVAAGNLPADWPYTSADLWNFLQPYSIPEAAVRYVLAHEVGTCCVGFRSEERMRENLLAIDPPYLDEARLARARELFGRIGRQVR
ncbi:MAG: aldo/keto reductase [Planctomycetota bacterium]|nr:aldo/keto reductase [Planctomycetota bacterium]